MHELLASCIVLSWDDMQALPHDDCIESSRAQPSVCHRLDAVCLELATDSLANVRPIRYRHVYLIPPRSQTRILPDFYHYPSRSSTCSEIDGVYEIMESPVKYILSLRAVRERAKIVWEAAKEGSLSHFDLHEEKIEDAADFVTTVIKVRDYALLATQHH
jgi:hypothetical protein